MVDLAFLDRREAVALGSLPNAKAIHLHGENIYAITGQNAIWDFGFGALYSFPSSAQQFKIKSTSPLDDATPPGTGVNAVTIRGLDENWQETTQFARMEGTSFLTIAKLMRRVNSMESAAAGSAGTNVGNIGLYQNDETTLIGLIQIGFNHTLSGVYTVPAGKRLIILRAEFRCTVAALCDIAIRNDGALERLVPLEDCSSAALNDDRNGAIRSLPIAFEVGAQRDIEPIVTQAAASSSAFIDIDAILVDE